MDGFLIIYTTMGLILLGLFLAVRHNEKHSK